MKLSILMAAYDEAARIDLAIKQVLGTPYPCDIELVVVDDGSRDNTWEILRALDDPRLIVTRHPENRGKGAAVKTAAGRASGDYMIIFDADLEYSPDDIGHLLHAVLHDDAVVVFGARRFGSSTAHSFWFVLGNKLTTFAANALFNSWISDLHTCLKLMPLPLFRELPLRQNGFGLDTELTARLLARGIRPYEVPIGYKARSHQEGKKISWRDGVESLWILARVRLQPRPRTAR
ncbi:MAG: glycosyltransferase family 2 protein [Actinomycetota bacterium]|nr:glycosyltransferase family 2 protein [Actinomycetota bacterium]